MSSSPKKSRLFPPRPKITLPVPSQFPGHFSQTPMGYVTSPYGQSPVPLTPVSGQPTIVYPNKASDFVFAHFKGFKDWTKSGLSHGEKSAFWLYEKVSSWSKRWFTHIFLFFVLFLYSVLGAFLFIYIEGKYENVVQEDIKKERDDMIQKIRDLWNDEELVADSEKWKGHAKNHLMLYEEKLYQFLKKLNFQSHPDSVNWAFWNAVIYCSTIYTTIVEGEINSMDEDEERRARMERMVEDTERLEKMMVCEEDRSRSKTRQCQIEESILIEKVRANSPAINRIDKSEGILREDELKSREINLTKNTELPIKNSEQQILIERHPSMKTRRKSRESNDEMELRRRMSSPEAAKIRVARNLSTSSSTTMNPYDDEQFVRRGSKKRISSHHRYHNSSDEDELPVAVEHRSRRRSPAKSLKKQIIPLKDANLVDDLTKAKRAYVRGESLEDYEYDNYEQEMEEEEYIPRHKRESIVRKRKTSLIHTDQEKERISKNVKQSTSWFSWIPFFGSNKQKTEETSKDNDRKKSKKKDKHTKELFSAKTKPEKTLLKSTEQTTDKVTFRELFRSMRNITAEFNEYCRQNPREVQILCELRNLCIVEIIITVIVCGLGGLVFRFTEGAFESFYKCGVKRVKRDFLDSLWNYSHNMKEDDWKSMARRKLMEFEEQLHTAHEAGVQTYSGQRSWSFLNAMVYCLTIVSTIGYGHISPSTTTGRALTIIYAIFGIPMFLIVLADFGKLFTRGIKFLWAFVRRLYYTGSCRKVRRTVPMQEMMKGVQLVYDLATFRRPSQMSPEDLAEMQRQQQTVLSLDGNTPQQADSPSTPAMSTFEIDDEFNLPISVAITILILYIFIGATIFNIFEDWTFFESFYFVFISMSTIGFGDFVPQDPLYMMLSIVYLIFGLALTSMCINVVQVMLADQFKHASQKIGASIGFQVSEEDGSLKPAAPDPVEVAEVHSATVSPTTTTATDFKDKLAPRAKQETDEL